MKSIDKYIIGKLVFAFTIVLLGMLSLAWLGQVLKMLDEIIMRGVDLKVFFILTVTVLPNIIAQIIPLVVFTATSFTLQTLASDKELLVLMSSGMTPKKLFRPFFYFGVILTILLLVFSLFLGPSGMRYTKFKIHEIRHDLSGTLIRDGMFSMPAKGLTVYAHKKDSNVSIEGILVHDNRNALSPITYSAEKGYLVNKNNNPKLILLNGSIQHRNLLLDGPGMTTVSFEKNEYLFSEFLTEDKNLNFDSSQRYIGDLLFPSIEDEYAKSRKNTLRAAGNHKLAQIIHPLALIIFSFSVFIKGRFDRRERSKNIIKLTTSIILFQLIDFFVASQAQSNLAPILILYLLPVLLILICLLSIRDNILRLEI